MKITTVQLRQMIREVVDESGFVEYERGFKSREVRAAYDGVVARRPGLRSVVSFEEFAEVYGARAEGAAGGGGTVDPRDIFLDIVGGA